ncbi:MAG: V-type ATP synthase subunit E family protein [Bacillota bacterium]
MKEGADRIVQRVLDDAQANADAIKEEANKKGKSAEDEARKKAERRKEHILEQARKTADEQKGRIIGVAQLESRKDLLAAKQEMISEAFQKALDDLVNLDDQDYLAIIHDLLINMTETGSETVIFSERDQKRISEDFWQQVNKDLVSKGEKGELKLSEETRDIKGGFILQSGGVEMNCSFEALLEMKRDELEPEIAGLLFK